MQEAIHIKFQSLDYIVSSAISIMNNLFQNHSQIDVTTVLMLLGEATIWKAIWTRFQFRRLHWKNWIFPVSLGWTPLAATLFTAISSSSGSPNLIFDRPPESSIDNSLVLTNLNSGASHAALNTIVQNIWNSWKRGPRQKSNPERRGHMFDTTKEVGVVDLNLDAFFLENKATFWFQLICLGVQIIASFVLAFFGWGFETFVALCVAIIGQSLVLLSITPSYRAWHMPVRGHRGCAVMLHRGLDSTEVLIIRKVILNRREVSMEEFTWDNHTSNDFNDKLKVAVSAIAFLILALHIVLVGWMSKNSRLLYLLFGGFGLLANALQAACSPDWSRAFQQSFSGKACCAPFQSSLLGAVGILLAAEFPASREAAQSLYPDNRRFKETVTDVTSLLSQILCHECRKAVRSPQIEGCQHQCMRKTDNIRNNACCEILAAKALTITNKQLKDALAAVSHSLNSWGLKGQIPTVETVEAIQHISSYNWTFPIAMI